MFFKILALQYFTVMNITHIAATVEH